MEEFRAFCNEITCEDICDGVYFSFVKNINGKMIELRTKSTDDYICKMFEDMKKDGWDFEYIKVKPYKLSSSMVRDKINKGESIDKSVPSKVKKIIDVFSLHRKEEK